MQVINREKSLKQANQVDTSRPIFSREDEIYTFALMAYNILTSNVAYKEFKNLNTDGFVTFFFSVVTAKLRPQFPPELNVPDKLAKLISFGWNDNSQYRPKVADFVSSTTVPFTAK